MNELMDQIGKRMPYRESEVYLDGLIDRATENALKQRSSSPNWWNRSRLVSAAAVALLIIGIGFTVLHSSSQRNVMTMQSSGPIDEFLNELTDEEVAQLPYYEIEEIPEY